MLAILVAATFGLLPQYESDARLRTPVSIDAPIITIGDTLRRISDATGVKFTSSDNLAAKKATIFVKSQPSAELLAAMADTFNLTLTPSGSGYTVAISREASTDEAESARRDSIALHTALDTTLSGIATKSDLTRRQVALQQSKLTKDRASLGTDKSPDAKSKRDAIDFQLLVLRMAHWSGVARVLLERQLSTYEALEEGSTLFASTRPNDDCPHIGDEVRQYLGPGQEALGIMRLNTSSERFESHFLLLGQRSGYGAGANFNLLDNDIEPYPEVRHCRAWAAKSDESLKGAKLAADGTRPVSVVQTLGDVLASLHKRTTVPIVSDAFRVPCSVGRIPGNTVQEVLASIADWSGARFRRGEVAFRMRDGWIEGRHIGSWRLQGREIPESSIAPLEATVAKGQIPSVDQFADFAASIDQKQLDGLNDEFFPTVVRFPSSVMGAVNSLRIWSLLDDSQRALARSQSGLPLASVGETQGGSVVANLRAMLLTLRPTADQLPVLLGDPAALKRTRLFLTIGPGKMFDGPLNIASGTGDTTRPALVDAEMVMFYYGERQAGSIQDSYALPKPGAGRAQSTGP